ncbi:hypothetical protein [Klebsiella aerogenes]|uniref:hypothetical protein n=1 Tax=Klebsiella aerogenes TaxID=548 RepID=UPI002175B5C0|nr:hypothetical protein [Klebsiella aerogenes]UWC45381.1 hypothetical protein M5S98_16940 [Klebsiella aerogenes]HCJ5307325.1 hypothetical protein [Klebsiella aerogenes]
MVSNSSRLWDRFEDASHDNGMQMTSISNDAITALEAAEKRIAELESRTVTVKLPSLNPEMFNGDVMFGYRKAQKEAVEFCSAAGIKVEVESWA